MNQCPHNQEQQEARRGDRGVTYVELLAEDPLMELSRLVLLSSFIARLRSVAVTSGVLPICSSRSRARSTERIE